MYNLKTVTPHNCFMKSKVFDDPQNFDKDKDLVMFVGDFNVNSIAKHKDLLNLVDWIV